MNKDCITYEGESISELQSDFEGAVDMYLQSCAERGVSPCKPYMGKFVVRMTSDLHWKVAMISAELGTTINDFINRAVQREVESIAL